MNHPPTEVWQRGPVDGIPALLQPVAHALLQAVEEVDRLLLDFPDDLLWERPAGVAAVGFHLQHLSGVLDRIFTYARGEQLNDAQRARLQEENLPSIPGLTGASLVSRFHEQVNLALEQLRNTDPNSLNEFRGIGKQQLPSTVTGLLFHAAEHTMRHLGQLLVTCSVLTNTAAPRQPE
jgi:uncharacterized damage-inducible protein DinB